jgi:hypothetical protein
MNLNKFTALIAVALTSVLAACDDPKTIEGTVWINGNTGSPTKMAGIPVTLLPPRVRDAIKIHVGTFGSQIASAQAKAIEDAVATDLATNQAEIKSFAQQFLDEASLQLGEAKKRVDAVTVIERHEQESYDVTAAPINERLRSLKEAAKPIDAKIEEQAALLAAEQAKLDLAFAERKAELEGRSASAKSVLAREKVRLDALQAEVAKKRQELGKELDRRYSIDKIKINARIHYSCSSCQPKLCVLLHNAGDKAVISITPRLFVNGKDVTELVEQLLHIPSQWQELNSFSVKNEYEEKVEGLPPGGKWPARMSPSLDECSVDGFWLNSTKGDGKRAWDSIGGLSAKTNVEVRVGQATLADAKNLSNVISGRSKVWRYVGGPPEKVFASEIEAMIDSTTKAQLAERARAIEIEEAAVALAETNLKGIKPDIATSQLLVDAHAERKSIDLEVEKVVAELAKASVSLQRAKDDKQALMKTLATAEAVYVERRGRLQTLDARVVSLTQKKGAYFDAIMEKAKASISVSVIEEKWYADLLKILKDAGGVTIQSDIDGRFRFEKVTWKLPLLFAISEERNETIPALPGRRASTTQRMPSYFWMETVDTSKTTLIDLGQSHAVRLTKGFVPTVMSKVSSAVGLPLPNATVPSEPKAGNLQETVSSEKIADASEAICFSAHKASLINPETLEFFDFSQMSNPIIGITARVGQAEIDFKRVAARAECKNKQLRNKFITDEMVEACAKDQISPDLVKYDNIFQKALSLGDKAKVFTFRAKAASRVGQVITHEGVCLINADGTVMVAQKPR